MNVADALRKFNYPEYIANLVIDMDFNNLGIFDMVTDSNDLSLEDIDALRDLFVEDAISTFVIKPKMKMTE
jgi:hypothetical protein